MTNIQTTTGIVKLGFKDEGEDDDGLTIGPVFAYYQDGSYGRVQGGWFTRKQARTWAAHLGVPLEEL